MNYLKLSRTISDEPGKAWCENAAVNQRAIYRWAGKPTRKLLSTQKSQCTHGDSRAQDPVRGQIGGKTTRVFAASLVLDGSPIFCKPIKKGRLFNRPWLRGEDLNLRPLGYEHNLVMASPFVSKHLVSDGVRF